MLDMPCHGVYIARNYSSPELCQKGCSQQTREVVYSAPEGQQTAALGRYMM